VDTWVDLDARDGGHRDSGHHRSCSETPGTPSRFRFATEPGVVDVDVELPRPPAAMADGSSIGVPRVRELPPIAVEVRLRRHGDRPSTDQVDELRRWLRAHRIAAHGTPEPFPALRRETLPPPPVVLQPVIRVEAPRRGALWPLLALSLGLAAALVAVMVL
jgi:hypothetical protein